MVAKTVVLHLPVVPVELGDIEAEIQALMQLTELTDSVTEKFKTLDEIRKRIDELTAKIFLRIVEAMPLFMPYMTLVPAGSLGINDKSQYRLVSTYLHIVAVEDKNGKPGRWYVVPNRYCNTQTIHVTNHESVISRQYEIILPPKYIPREHDQRQSAFCIFDPQDNDTLLLHAEEKYFHLCEFLAGYHGILGFLNQARKSCLARIDTARKQFTNLSETLKSMLKQIENNLKEYSSLLPKEEA